MGFGTTFGAPRFVSIAAEQVRELEETHDKPIEEIITDGGGTGGSVADINFDVNPAYSEDHQLSDTEIYFYIRLTNSSDAPSAVSLSFSGNILEANTFDTGTAQNPSYVIQPGIGNHRDIVLLRSSGAPQPNSKDANGNYLSSSCTITYTLADGTVSDYSTNITVYAKGLETVAEAVDYHTTITPSSKVLELKFEGNLNNTGLALTNLNIQAISTTYTATATNSIAGVTGYADSAGTGYIRLAKPNNVQLRSSNLGDFANISGQPRSWLYVFQYKVQNTQSHSILGNMAGISGHPLGGQPMPIKYASNNAYIQGDSPPTGTQAANTRSLDTTRNHTINGLGFSEAFNWGLNDICIYVASWDGTDITLRWKQTGHGDGHSFATWDELYSSGSSYGTVPRPFPASGVDWTGSTYDGGVNTTILRNDSTRLRWLYYSVYNLETTGDMFDHMCSALEL